MTGKHQKNNRRTKKNSTQELQSILWQRRQSSFALVRAHILIFADFFDFTWHRAIFIFVSFRFILLFLLSSLSCKSFCFLLICVRHNNSQENQIIFCTLFYVSSWLISFISSIYVLIISCFMLVVNTITI